MLPRSTWYWWQSREAIGCDVALCDIIRQIAIRHKRRYGYRRVTATLHNQGCG
ncbi:IS3 family transposase [Rahnella variigena]|uniref:IS3 family transposase n=1 Tax=Rahnella variigena TaxID=574964 RepID=UPI001045C1F0